MFADPYRAGNPTEQLRGDSRERGQRGSSQRGSVGRADMIHHGLRRAELFIAHRQHEASGQHLLVQAEAQLAVLEEDADAQYLPRPAPPAKRRLAGWDPWWRSGLACEPCLACDLCDVAGLGAQDLGDLRVGRLGADFELSHDLWLDPGFGGRYSASTAR